MIAFVLGGGGPQGAHEVGMLRALAERCIVPDLVIGTSVGALNGAAFASDPTPEMVERLKQTWLHLDEDKIFGGSILAGATNLLKFRPHMHSNRALRHLVREMTDAQTFDDLKVAFQCVAASIERASEHWFSEGPLEDALLASCAVPGVYPPVEIDGEHYIDGGVVNSIPVSRALELGATEIYVLQVGRVERPLVAPKTPFQTGIVAFEVARRHRFARDLATLPEGVTAHVLPTGSARPAGTTPIKDLNIRAFKAIEKRIETAYEATSQYLSEV